MIFGALVQDDIEIIKGDGSRSRAYSATFSPEGVTIFDDALDVFEGDHLARKCTDGSEEFYLVLHAMYLFDLGTGPDNYRLKVRKTQAAPRLLSAS